MSSRSNSPVQRVQRRGKTVLVIDFWYINEKGRKQRYRRNASVQTMTGARAEAARLQDRAARTGSPVLQENIPTFGEFVESRYRPLFMPRLRPGTRQRYEGILRQGVLEHFGRTPIDEIDKAAVLRFAAELQTRERGRTLRGKTHGIDPRGPCNLVRAVLRAAVEVGVLAEMPALPTYRPSEKLPDAPSPEHVAEVVRLADGWLQTAVALQVWAGLRQGEVRALQVRDVDLANGILHVRRSFSEDREVPPKGGHERIVPMLPELADILRKAVADKLPLALVVTDSEGRPLRRQGYLYHLKAFEKRHGLREWWSHALRHYFCTALARGGANVEAVRALAGHRNLTTTQRYLHATGGDLQAAIGKLGGNSLVTPRPPSS